MGIERVGLLKQKGTTTSSTSITLSITTEPDVNLMLVAFGTGDIIAGGPGRISSCTFNTTENLAQVRRTPNTDVASALWAVINPSQSTTANVVGTLASGSCSIAMGIIQYKGVLDPLTATDTKTAKATATSVSTAVTSAVGDLVIDALAVDTTSLFPTVNGDNSLLHNGVTGSGGSNSIRLSTSEFIADDASANMAWSFSSSTEYAQVAASINPVLKAARRFTLMGVGP